MTKTVLSRYLLYIAWIQSIAAFLISLYYSEIRHFVPCVLCWYQRILMYPLVLILAVGILKKDKTVYHYVLPLSISGFFIAFYHVLLQRGLISEVVRPCTTGVSCTATYVTYFGFITIPDLSLLAFALITVCMLFYRKYQGGK